MTPRFPWTSAPTCLDSEVLVAIGDNPEVVAVIPTLARDLPRLGRCVAALRAQTSSARLAVVIVLNTPEDVVLDFATSDGCSVLRPRLNLGWAGGLQLGRRAAPAEGRLWLVQDDMVPHPDCLESLWDELDADPALAVVSPLVLDAKGEVPSGSCGGVLRRVPDIDLDHWYPARDSRIDALGELDRLDYVPSRGMLVDLTAWDEVGGMFAGYYPVLWADVDFCTAIRAAGRRFAIATAAHTQHDGQGSTPSPFRQFLFARHRNLFRSRWATSRSTPFERAPLPPDLAVTVAIAAASLSSDLATEHARLTREVEDAQVAAVLLAEDRDRLSGELQELRASKSWRVTRPLRELRRILRGR